MVILTSFKKSKEVIKKLKLSIDNVYSVARFQPKGYNYKELRFLAAEDEYGNKLLLKDFKNPEKEFKEALKRSYRKKIYQIVEWLKSLKEEENIVLCCWCPYSSQKDNKNHYFLCHNGIIGQIIERNRPDITIILDEDRSKYL